MFSIEGLISLPNGENCNIIYVVWDILKIRKASTYYIKTYKRLLSNLRHIHVFFPDYEPIGYIFHSAFYFIWQILSIYITGEESFRAMILVCHFWKHASIFDLKHIVNVLWFCLIFNNLKCFLYYVCHKINFFLNGSKRICYFLHYRFLYIRPILPHSIRTSR